MPFKDAKLTNIKMFTSTTINRYNIKFIILLYAYVSVYEWQQAFNFANVTGKD